MKEPPIWICGSPRAGEVSPIEQMVHSLMEMMPLIGLSHISILKEAELRALVGISSRAPDFSLRSKSEPLPEGYRVALLGSIAVFGGIPYFEELWRTARYSLHEARAGSPRKISAERNQNDIVLRKTR
jgi:hypothetical protein